MRNLSIIQKIKNIIFLDRDEFSASYNGELNYQCSKVIFFASLVCIIAWLSYVGVDSQICPDQPLIPLLRYGLTAVSLIIFILQFFHFFKRYSMALLAILGLYLEAATVIITGLAKGDTVYMGGYFFVLMIPLVAPMNKFILWGEILFSVALFFVIGLSLGMEFVTVRDKYTLNDMVVVVLFTLGFIYILDRLRYASWQKSQQIDEASGALTEIIGFLETNRSFFIKFQQLVSSQDKNIHTVIDHLENSLEYTGYITELTEKNSNAIAQSQEALEQIHHFYDSLTEISLTFKQLSGELTGHVDNLQKTLGE